MGRIPDGVRMSESGNSSKLDVSSMLLISMGMAAGRSLWDGVAELETGHSRPLDSVGKLTDHPGM